MVGLRGSSDQQQAANEPAAKPAAPAPTRAASDASKVKTAEAPPAAPASSQAGSLINGAQPAPASSSFDSRWSAFR
jgi:hypothetical protein